MPPTHEGLGNYFVAAYPPFFTWSPAATGHYRRALRRGPAPGWGLYVHVPFCVERCRYCYYLSSSAPTHDRIAAYVDALLAEAHMVAGAWRDRAAGRRVAGPAFVYFGGGTPTLLPLAQLRRLVEQLAQLFPWRDAREVTFECAPRSVTTERLALLHEAGVTRISLGVQQLDDEVLAVNGRVHRVRDVERAWESARRFSFPVTNIDLIAGLVGQSEEGFLAGLERTIAMEPSMVTVYQLEVPFNTPLYADVAAGVAVDLPSWGARHRRLALAFERLEGAGYTVSSGYAAVRDPDRHRFVYQHDQYAGADLVGLGASAFSYVDGVHQQNIASVDGYVDAVRAGIQPLGRAFVLSPSDRSLRELLLQLKLGGVDRARMRKRHGADPCNAHGSALQELVRGGFLEIDSRRIRVTREGLVRIDALLPRLMPPQYRGGQTA